ncbi:hypothetical protein AAF712_005642 [Marasmius tenuissimus]|uniref:Uncharacterized protein n=1 Tax=Marasmius tenuissimus TaxID=585030 RepID=A0ABR3A308_9AGAR
MHRTTQVDTYTLTNFNISPFLEQAFSRKFDAEPDSDASSVLSSVPPSPCVSPTSPVEDNADVPPANLDEAQAPESSNKAKTGSKARGKRNRKRKRAMEKEEGGSEAYCTPPALKKKHVGNMEPRSVDVNLASMRVSANGFTGHRQDQGTKREYELSDMVGPQSKFKFDLVKWDGKRTKAFIDSEGRMIVIGVSFPGDSAWKSVPERLAMKVEEARSLTKIKKRNRRGRFKALQAGVSYGMGMKKPAVQGQSCRANKEAMDGLLEDRDLNRIAGLQSAAFETWSSASLYASYVENKRSLTKHDPSLRWNFSTSIFASITVNLGPRTVSIDHADQNNRCDSFCAITPLSPPSGGFDYRLGGHLILWDLRIVVEFPPGTTILLPSAVLRHSNVAIGKHEKRYSVTQYSAGALFRWAEHGFQSEDSFYSRLSLDMLRQEKERDDGRWVKSLDSFLNLRDVL